MKVNIQVQCGTKPLDQRYCASMGCLSRITYLLDQVQGDGAVNDAQHLACDQRPAGEEKAQLEWKTEHPLARRLIRKYLIYQQG